ncbi:hypothetical protein [Promicromonospora sp. MEB111]|uniref:hypothetical protein n=1 Tax=unclassified Promicromonospora TaxID=2647929 RepID=UPI002549F2C8|nr:hypothetical protein [Promicromonospora sp. MEB111]
MYNTPGVGSGVATGVVGAGTLAQTGFDGLWLAVAAITCVVGGFILIRASRSRRRLEVTGER